jgi:hypothetical protein
VYPTQLFLCGRPRRHLLQLAQQSRFVQSADNGDETLRTFGVLSLRAMLQKNIVGTQVRRHAPIVSQASFGPY